MAVNKYKPHIYIIPEDDANRQIALGFELDPRLPPKVLQVMKPAGGWSMVVQIIREEYLPLLRSNQNTHVLGIIDCDDHADRITGELDRLRQGQPENCQNRVFLLGTLGTPERFKASVKKTFEEIGEALAEECSREEFSLWSHDDCQHIQAEIQRAREFLRPILFGSE